MNTASNISKDIIRNGSVTDLLTALSGDQSRPHRPGGHLADFNDHLHDARIAGVDNTEFKELHKELKDHVTRIGFGRKPNRTAILRLLQYGYLLAHTLIYSKEEEEEEIAA